MTYFYNRESVQKIVLQRSFKFGYLKGLMSLHIYLRLLFKGYGVARERESGEALRMWGTLRGNCLESQFVHRSISSLD